MGQNDHLFMYVDKDKIIPWLDSEIKNTEESKDYRRAMLMVKAGINFGMWDWQQGS
jgi:hypothetical protein